MDRVAAGCLAVRLQRQEIARTRTCRRRVSFVSKSSDPDSHRQKRPDLRQHFFNSLPLPHGQRSLRPNFSSSCLFPCTTRTPGLTCVSDGKPFRRLLIVSKELHFVCVLISHGTPPLVRGSTCSATAMKCPRQELNLVYDLRTVACDPAHSEDSLTVEHPAEESNPVLRFRRPPCIRHTRKACLRHLHRG